ncbi:MAG: hypothetical protein ACFE8F_07315 [Promethearchaeota archaeon]
MMKIDAIDLAVLVLSLAVVLGIMAKSFLLVIPYSPESPVIIDRLVIFG